MTHEYNIEPLVFDVLPYDTRSGYKITITVNCDKLQDVILNNVTLHMVYEINYFVVKDAIHKINVTIPLPLDGKATKTVEFEQVEGMRILYFRLRKSYCEFAGGTVII